MTTLRRALTVPLALALIVPLSAASADATAMDDDSALVSSLTAVTRATAWERTQTLPLDFPTFHPEGLAVAGDLLFLSSVEVTEATVRYPEPVDGFDRTPGKGVGHVFVLNREGELLEDIVLGEGDMYHPGGIDFDGESVWVPVAQYRPGSSAIIYRIDVSTLEVTEEFRVEDHIGGIVLDETTGRLVGNNWGSRMFYEWTAKGRERDRWDNPSHFIDYQDCQYVPAAKMICGGIAALPQPPAAGGSTTQYELGGVALIALDDHTILHEVPFQQWSTAEHVVTRNPLKVFADGGELTLWAAPDDGDEGNGTELLRYEATVVAAP